MLGEIRIGNKSRGDEGIYVGRPSIFGNPLRLATHADTIDGYEDFLRDTLKNSHSILAKKLHELALKVFNGEHITLVCWCAPRRCHAEIIRNVLYSMVRTMQVHKDHGMEALQEVPMASSSDEQAPSGPGEKVESDS